MRQLILPLGLILNFKVAHMREGIKRFVNGKGWDQSPLSQAKKGLEP